MSSAETVEDIKEILIGRPVFSVEESFDLAKKCAGLLKDPKQSHKGRDIVIRVLDSTRTYPKQFPAETQSLWNDVVELSGLYPYLIPELLEGSSLLRYEFHRSKNLKIKDSTDSVYLHEEQQELYHQLITGNSVILSAPTSFGKSLLIEEIIASQKYKNIVIIQPTLALLDETRKKLNKYKSIYSVIVSTSQSPSSTLGNIFLFTGERVVEYKRFPKIDFFVIDEFYKLSLERDDDRAITLNQAFYKLLKQTKAFYLLGPSIKSISTEVQDKLNIRLQNTNFATVAIDEIAVPNHKLKKDELKAKLYELLLSLDEPTLIYCSSPSKAIELASEFSNYLNTLSKFIKKADDSKQNDDLIEWIKENISNHWSLINCLKNSVAFHNGILPRHLGSSIVDAFNNGAIKYLFCTSTLIEGVNTTAKNIVLFDNTKGNRIPIDFFDYKNIAGRSGRMNIHYIGKIYKFHNTPTQLQLNVDIPFISQTDAPAELLIQLDEAELTSKSVEKMKPYKDIDFNLFNVLKSNTGIALEGQLQVVKAIEANLLQFNSSLAWNGFPKYNQLSAAIELAWQHLIKKTDSKAGVRSAKQLATLTTKYSIYKSIKPVIDDQVNSKYWIEKEPDEYKRINEITYLLLNCTRHWFDYKLPKLLVTLSKLQEYVFKKHGLQYGDYTPFAAALENGFISSPAIILLEYDIPMSAVKKLSGHFYKDDELTNILKKLSAMDLKQLNLNNYERLKIAQII